METTTMELQMDVLGHIYGASMDTLKLLLDKVNVSVTEPTRTSMVQALTKVVKEHEKKDDMGESLLNELLSVINLTTTAEAEGIHIGSTVPVQTVTTTTPVSEGFPNSLWKREFRISGQIGRAKTALPHSSLLRQIDEGLRQGHSESEIINAVIRAVDPALHVRSYLENRADMDLKSLKQIILTHYQEPRAQDLFQSLMNASQGPNEEALDFVMRMLDLRQKIVFISKKENSQLWRQPLLLDSTLRQTIYTGLLSQTIRIELKDVLEDDTVTDESLLEAVMKSSNREEARNQKLNFRRSKVHTVEAENETASSKHKNSEIDKMRAEITQLREQVGKTESDSDLSKNKNSELKQLRVEIAQLKEQVGKNLSMQTSKYDYQTPSRGGCFRCRRTGDKCKHCWKCGAGDHYKVNCPKASVQGNEKRSPKWDMA